MTVLPRTHYQTGLDRLGYPLWACNADMLAQPRLTTDADRVTCYACKRTHEWKRAVRAATTTGGTE
jgi:hypothetical protein